MDLKSCKIGVVGLGYVGLPLMVEFAKKYPTVGFDINPKRIEELSKGHDHTRELDPGELAQATQATFTSNPELLADCNTYIITVPTPVDKFNRPDLSPLESACKFVGPYLRAGDCVIFESTVFPGATEEVCLPILENLSGLEYNKTLFLGYSPERINPGDKKHRITTITKVTSGSTPESAEYIDSLYASIIPAGTHKASSIKVAEAAKVIENTQRDLNIALINELTIIFELLGIDTEEVLKAAGTKWNFLPFRPGLVGGHCISVDPYYLTHKAQELGYHPDIILAGRRINDGMGLYISERIVKEMARKRINIVDADILVMGLSFKENCPDTRNTRVVDLIDGLKEYRANVSVYDPWVDTQVAEKAYAVSMLDYPETGKYDAVILAVGHEHFREIGLATIRRFAKETSVIFDIKYLFPQSDNLARL